MWARRLCAFWTLEMFFFLTDAVENRDMNQPGLNRRSWPCLVLQRNRCGIKPGCDSEQTWRWNLCACPYTSSFIWYSLGTYCIIVYWLLIVCVTSRSCLSCIVTPKSSTSCVTVFSAHQWCRRVLLCHYLLPQLTSFAVKVSPVQIWQICGHHGSRTSSHRCGLTMPLSHG